MRTSKDPEGDRVVAGRKLPPSKIQRDRIAVAITASHQLTFVIDSTSMIFQQHVSVVLKAQGLQAKAGCLKMAAKESPVVLG